MKKYESEIIKSKDSTTMQKQKISVNDRVLVSVSVIVTLSPYCNFSNYRFYISKNGPRYILLYQVKQISNQKRMVYVNPILADFIREQWVGTIHMRHSEQCHTKPDFSEEEEEEEEEEFRTLLIWLRDKFQKVYTIDELKNIQKLSLRYNELTSIPPEIGLLHNLQILALGDNKLTFLPPEIGQLKNLRDLYLNGNELTSLPPEIGKLIIFKLWI
jgi:Leucine-rich repeat (LRR) protein